MIISEIKGGLGNQLFMYAAGLSVARRTGGEFKLDNTWYADVRWHHFSRKTHANRAFALPLFRISAGLANRKEILQFTLPQDMPRLFLGILKKFRKNRNVYKDGTPGVILSKLGDPSYLKGYWMDPAIAESVRDELREELVFKDGVLDDCSEWEHRIRRAEQAVCVHIRRGDYADKLDYDALLDYVGRAVETMKSRIGREHLDLFVFSDDLPWCRGHLAVPGCDVHFVEHSPDISARSQNDFHLMTLCRHFIVPRSTFSYWAAWVGTNEETKEQRQQHVVICQRTTLPEGWITL